jgi:nucleoid-associated protein YgaU
MTSDAKLGLLLGLIFIFLIALIINGIPRFRAVANDNELAEETLNFDKDSLGLASGARKAQETLDWAEYLQRQADTTQPETDSKSSGETIRSTIPLPESSPMANQSDELHQTELKVTSVASPTTAFMAERSDETALSDTPEPRVYVVCDGDNLANIAKKFYGPQQGNKRRNVMRIFAANRSQLRSPDEVHIGQKLVIPPLTASTADGIDSQGVFSEGLFKRVESIGKKHLSSLGHAEDKGRWYVVQEGDSLWEIAAKQLGNGSRYKEIVKLNAGILNNEDDIAVGMRLKMPTR